jgi:hypothetical protein
MAIQTVDDLVLDLAVAFQGLGRIIDILEERLDHTNDENERRAIFLRLPVLESDRRDIQAKIIAIQAVKDRFPLPPVEVAAALADATSDLSARLAGAQRIDVLFGLATKVIASARQVANA